MRSIGCVILGLLILGCQSARQDRASAQRTAPDQFDDARLARAQAGPQDVVGTIHPVAYFYDAMPTGVAVSQTGRIFVCFPRWGDAVEFTVAEVHNGRAVPFPTAQLNQLESDELERFISVQSVVIDPLDRLWILDTGSINFGPVQPGAAKLVGIDLARNTIFQTITFPDDVVLPTTYLNDVRFDLSRGEAGYAFITDSSGTGPNGIIVVDLRSGHSWRRLHDHPSTKADEGFVPLVEGEPLLITPGDGTRQYLKIGADGIAIDSARGLLFYCPLAGRDLYAISVDVLIDRTLPEEWIAPRINHLGTREFASDGLASDADGLLYLTDYESNAIHRRSHDGLYQIIAQSPQMLWPDSLAFGPDGHLYFTVNQLNRQPQFQEGQDRRQPPYVLFRTRITPGESL